MPPRLAAATVEPFDAAQRADLGLCGQEHAELTGGRFGVGHDERAVPVAGGEAGGDLLAGTARSEPVAPVALQLGVVGQLGDGHPVQRRVVGVEDDAQDPPGIRAEVGPRVPGVGNDPLVVVDLGAGVADLLDRGEEQPPLGVEVRIDSLLADPGRGRDTVHAGRE